MEGCGKYIFSHLHFAVWGLKMGLKYGWDGIMRLSPGLSTGFGFLHGNRCPATRARLGAPTGCLEPIFCMAWRCFLTSLVGWKMLQLKILASQACRSSNFQADQGWQSPLDLWWSNWLSIFKGSTKQHRAGNESFCSAVSAAEVHSIKHQLATEFLEIRLLQ